MPPRKPVSIIQLGLGGAGRELLKIHLEQGPNPRLQWLGVGDASCLWLAPDGWQAPALADMLALQSTGMPLSRWRPGVFGVEAVPAPEAYSPALLWRLDELGIRKTMTADLMPAGAETLPLLKELRSGGHNLLLARPDPLACPYEEYREFTTRGRGLLNYSPTAAGRLQLVRVLDGLRAAGDQVTKIEAAPCGGLNFITEMLTAGLPFGVALRQAQSLCLVESDPRHALCGHDAAHLMLLLARHIGLPLEVEHVRRESLLPARLEHAGPAELSGGIADLDQGLGAWSAQARARGTILRYMASLDLESGLELRLSEVPASGLAGHGCGPYSLFVVYTYKLGDQPIVLRGPATGPEHTAAAVFAELAAISRG